MPRRFLPVMIARGTATVAVGVKREAWVPFAGETYFCLRWVVRHFGLKEPVEVDAEVWSRMDAMQKHIFALRDQEARQGTLEFANS